MKYPFLPKYLRIIPLLFLFFSIGENSQAQNFFGTLYKTDHVHDEHCGAVDFEMMLQEKYGRQDVNETFEAWMQEKIRDRKSNPAIQRNQQEVRLIPVVIHVIHNGTEIGEGANIPMVQIESQMRVLNEDFRRLNQDANQTPTQYLPVAADAHIEFVLAKQDPRGRPTNGVVRVEGPRASYSIENLLLSGQISLWPPEDYLNIWVMPISGPLGVGSPPISSLPGWGNLIFPRESNGIWVDYRWFGEGGNAVPESRGRIATHEVGHFFSLRHIWGDGGCNVDDFVDDTPLQEGNNNFVCRIGQPRFTCGSRDMTENYMDYTSDACQNLFTQGQVDRFNVVLAESPFRASLVNGRATIAPDRFENDMGIERVIEPLDLLCNLEFTPMVEVFNNGLNRVNSARITISNNGVILETKDFELDLGEFEAQTLSFDPVSLPPAGNNFVIRIVLVNNVVDPNPSNNEFTSAPVIQPEIGLPYSLDFDDIGQDWIISNPDEGLTWEETDLTLDGQSTKALVVRNFIYENEGTSDLLISPRIDLTNIPNAQLTFLVAHAPRPDVNISDVLVVAVSTDCGNNFDILDPPYEKDPLFLSTSDPTSTEFIPTRNDQFRREILDLSPYAGNPNVRIAIINQNDNGNNIYIKDIQLLDQEQFRYDVSIDNLNTPLPISANLNTEENLSITNTGNLPLTGFIFRRRTNASPAQLYVFRGLVSPGETVDLILPKSTTEGNNRLDYSIFFPSFDQNMRGQIELIRYVIHDSERLLSPWRESFINVPNIRPWISVNPEGNITAFTLAPVQSGIQADNSVVIQNTLTNNSYWFGTPILDLSRSSQASILFELAAGQVSPNTVFRVLGSQDAGNTYKELWRKTGSEISTVSTPDVDRNSRESYREEFIDLSEFAGRGNQNGRVAFVLENGDQNNSPIYLDNFEFFLSANPEPVRPELGSPVLYPNPARDVFNLAFNLRSFENVNIQIISSNGALVHDVDYPNTLNQTYSFSSRNFSKGLFIIKITSRNISETKKLFIH
ncbi:choice-of-anchor J domain-containing protein [Aquiflexum sp.]|uniref:zinc-dependent metalloprotease n=1 Tax=Aquiflexum sp. TaxID=1872584 RepID=UPI003593FC71